MRPGLEISGMGSVEMTRAGIDVFYDSAGIAVVGLVEVLRHWGEIKRAMAIVRERMEQAPPDLLVLVDDAERAVRSDANFLWMTFTRFEPAADITASNVGLRRLHASFTPPVAIDSRLTPGFPDELFCDDETARTVDGRWAEYFPEGNVEMGDSDRGHLD